MKIPHGGGGNLIVWLGWTEFTPVIGVFRSRLSAHEIGCPCRPGQIAGGFSATACGALFGTWVWSNRPVWEPVVQA